MIEKTTHSIVVGQFLAVGWSDGFVRLMGLENNKAAHHIKVGESSGNKITHIGWASGSIAGKSSSAVSQALKDGLGEDPTRNGGGLPLDLPRELTFLEVDTVLPKISPLPSSSAGSGYVLSFHGRTQHTNNPLTEKMLWFSR